jgi:predicted outer membrane repeat protein
MTNSSLVDNAAQSGGGLLMFHSSAVLTNVHVISNTATASGGGIYGQLSTLEMGASFADCSPSALPDHTYCSEIRGNSADNFGGGIYFGLGGSTATIEDTAFLDNEGASDGEAFLVTDYTAVTVTNSLFSGHGVNSNPAVSVPGQDTYFTSINSTYAGNHHIPLSVTQDATTTLTLNIMWDNALPADIHSQAGLTSQCNDTQIGLGGSGDISVNPQFINLRGPYRLKHTSPAIDRCIGTTNHDLDGNPRPIDAIGGVSLFEHDMGAFEAYPPTFIPLALNNF